MSIGSFRYIKFKLLFHNFIQWILRFVKFNRFSRYFLICLLIFVGVLDSDIGGKLILNCYNKINYIIQAICCDEFICFSCNKNK